MSTNSMARWTSLWFWAAFATLVVELRALKGLRRCPFGHHATPEPSWRVVQVIRGQLHQWEEYQLDGGAFCIVKLYPNRKVLGVLEAQKLLMLSKLSDAVQAPDSTWAEFLPSRRATSNLSAEDLPYSINDTTSWYEERSGSTFTDVSVSASDQRAGGREGLPWIGKTENGTAGRVVIGEDERTEVKDTQKFPYQGIGYVEMIWPNGAMGRCTAFLVSPFVALTNAHCIYRENWGGWIGEATFSPAQYMTEDGVLSRPYGTSITCNVATNTGYIHRPNSAQDYAAIFFSNPVPGMGTFIPLVFPFTPKLGSKLFMAGYPGLPQEVFSEEMWESSGEVVTVSDRLIQYTVDTSAGQSGSPLFRPVGFLLDHAAIGLHAFGRLEGNGGPRFVQENEALIFNWMKDGPAACSVN